MFQSFRGRRYRVIYDRPGKNNGECQYAKPRHIKIAPGLKGLALLDTIIHEGLHACYPDLDDDAVDEAGVSLAAFLWRHGCRATIPMKPLPKRK